MPRLALLGAAFLLGGGFTSDSAGRACVQQKGARGTAYDIHRTKITEAYSPSGRRLIQDGHRLYTVEVPPLMKRDKPILCTMPLDRPLWRYPGVPDPLDAPRVNPFASPPAPTPPEMIGSGSR